MFFNLYSNVWIGFDLALKIWLNFFIFTVTDCFRNTTRMSSGGKMKFEGHTIFTEVYLGGDWKWAP